jgi:hypothetical protein
MLKAPSTGSGYEGARWLSPRQRVGFGLGNVTIFYRAQSDLKHRKGRFYWLNFTLQDSPMVLKKWGFKRWQAVVQMDTILKLEAVKQLFWCAPMAHHAPVAPLLDGRMESQESAEDDNLFNTIHRIRNIAGLIVWAVDALSQAFSSARWRSVFWPLAGEDVDIDIQAKGDFPASEVDPKI